MIEVKIDENEPETIRTVCYHTYTIPIEVAKDNEAADMSITIHFRTVVDEDGKTRSYLDEFSIDGRPESHDGLGDFFCEELAHCLDLTEKELNEVWVKVEQERTDAEALEALEGRGY